MADVASHIGVEGPSRTAIVTGASRGIGAAIAIGLAQDDWNVVVNYRSRTYAEGKKVRFFRDPLTWLETIVASRFEPLGEEDAP